jgi:hypothetical protein
VRDLELINITIADAVSRIEKLKEGLKEFAPLLSEISVAASDALKNNMPLVTPPHLLAAKARHEKLVDEISFAESGLVQLRANLEQKNRDLVILNNRVAEALAPILLDEGERLATEVARLESLAAIARAKLTAFSQSGQGGHVQKLGPHAAQILRDKPPNCEAPMTNTHLWRRTQSFKKSFVEYRQNLEVDAGTRIHFSE